MPEPKFVVAVGDCAVDGGVFKGSYAVTGGAGHDLARRSADQRLSADPGADPGGTARAAGSERAQGRRRSARGRFRRMVCRVVRCVVHRGMVRLRLVRGRRVMAVGFVVHRARRGRRERAKR